MRLTPASSAPSSSRPAIRRPAGLLCLAALMLLLSALLTTGCQPAGEEITAPDATVDADSLAGTEDAVVEDPKSRYLGLTPPGLQPEVFAPGVVSLEERSEFGSVFTANGLEFYFGIDTEGRTEI